MNKKLLPIIIILSIVLSLTIFVACDNEEADPHQFLNIKLSDGTSTEAMLNVEYKYGEQLTILNNLKIILEYKDGNITLDWENESHKEIIEAITVTYAKSDGTEIDPFNPSTILTPGNYTITVSYNGSMATLSIFISQADFVDNYSIYIQDTTATSHPVSSQYNYGDKNKTFALYAKSGGAELNKSLLNSLPF